MILVGDYSCSKKIENINFSKIFNKNYWQKEYDQNLNCISNCKSEEKAKEIVNKTIRTITGKNTTSIIYERSISTNIATFKKNILGWGFNNNDMATKNWINDNKYLMNVRKIYGLNYNDGLGNLFKLINEFGIFVFLLFYYFSFYLLKKEKIKPHKIFFISIFVVQLFRSAGYFNGGFLLAIIEILFFKKFIKN